MKSQLKISQKKLQGYLNELIALAKSMAPEAQSFVQIPGDEGQHAWLMLYVPDELEEQIGDVISARANEIFINTGYDIAAVVFEISQLSEDHMEMNA